MLPNDSFQLVGESMPCISSQYFISNEPFCPTPRKGGIPASGVTLGYVERMKSIFAGQTQE